MNSNPNEYPMKRIVLIVLSAFSLLGFAQKKGITFQVEELSKPENTIPMCSGNTIFERLILSEEDLEYEPVRRDSTEYPSYRSPK